MTSCCHCGSPIVGKASTVKVKEFRLMYFHEDPKECYVKQTVLNHNYPDPIRQALVMVGVTE